MASNRPKLESIRGRAEFQRLRESGRSIHSQWLVANFEVKETVGIQLGLTLPRHVGSAVVRNRLRRWSKEFFRARCKLDVSEGEGWRISIYFRPRPKDFYAQLEHEQLDQKLGFFWSKMVGSARAGNL